jgi:hypothetical protein
MPRSKWETTKTEEVDNELEGESAQQAHLLVFTLRFDVPRRPFV